MEKQIMEKQILEQENFKYSETTDWGADVYSQELVSPENSECSCKIKIYFSDKWCASITDYYGNRYDGCNYYQFKSLKVLMNRLHKDYSFFGF